jgi:hypothetical protein
MGDAAVSDKPIRLSGCPPIVLTANTEALRRGMERARSAWFRAARASASPKVKKAMLRGLGPTKGGD